MDENNMTAAGQAAPAAAQTEAPAEAAGQTVTIGALRGAIERRQEQNMRRAAEQTAARWSHEADELTAQCPDFDLGAALNDARFCALLRAGIDVRTAWFALHAQALLETACLRAGRVAHEPRRRSRRRRRRTRARMRCKKRRRRKTASSQPTPAEGRRESRAWMKTT